MTSEVNGSGIGSRFPNPTASSVGGDANQYINQLLSGSLDGSYEPADTFEKKQGEVNHKEASSPLKTLGKWLVYGLAAVGAWKMGGGTIIKTAFNSIFRREENAGFRSLFQGWGGKGKVRDLKRETESVSEEGLSDIEKWRRKTPPGATPDGSVIDISEPIDLVENDIAENAGKAAGKTVDNEAGRTIEKDVEQDALSDVSHDSAVRKGAEDEAVSKTRRSSRAMTEDTNSIDGIETPRTEQTPVSSSAPSEAGDLADEAAQTAGAREMSRLESRRDTSKSSSKTDDLAEDAVDEEITRTAEDIERFQAGKDKNGNP